jgi:DNA processing protein
VDSSRIVAIPASSPEFPSQLADLDLVPDPIFTIGKLATLEGPLVSIVGTRDPTAYGLRIARSIASALVENGVGIVSGMARGIDAAVHRTALESGGRTVAVLGTGVDVPYPAAHTELHRVIGERGLVVSENGTGARAHKGSFPRRNRIIAALGMVTIVIEAGLKSGALSTARHALELGRTLAALPGPIDSPQSMGANLLLRDGAAAISSVADALSLAGITSAVQPQPLNLSDTDARVWSAIGAETLPLDTIAVRARLAPRECMAAVTTLELSGMVESLITGEIRRRI